MKSPNRLGAIMERKAIVFVMVVSVLWIWVAGTAYGADALPSRLDRKHADRGLTCAGCHETSAPKEKVTKTVCLRCHKSYDALWAKSSIHGVMVTPHFNGGDECGRCHKVHKASALFCGECHSAETKNP